ncbi:MAG: hypothetical protein ABEK12_03875, partial [Candidatus Nanohaloarchaea archaeon]
GSGTGPRDRRGDGSTRPRPADIDLELGDKVNVDWLRDRVTVDIRLQEIVPARQRPVDGTGRRAVTGTR